MKRLSVENCPHDICAKQFIKYFRPWVYKIRTKVQHKSVLVVFFFSPFAYAYFFVLLKGMSNDGNIENWKTMTAQFHEVSANQLRLRYYKNLNMIPKPSPSEQMVIAKQWKQSLPMLSDAGLHLKVTENSELFTVNFLQQKSTNIGEASDTNKHIVSPIETTSESPLLSPLPMSFHLDLDSPLSNHDTNPSSNSQKREQTPQSASGYVSPFGAAPAPTQTMSILNSISAQCRPYTCRTVGSAEFKPNVFHMFSLTSSLFLFYFFFIQSKKKNEHIVK
ncbi:hypothetical protein RFI_06098 [Reticulomyxa filosa]|uniref:Uncharacterized protein n=1 Tax=Reticulomyxa filosa TaxID=46433 RepID=X6NXJ1_RETFI|nr:hypothetical protein RFI_06098 [Reticulomyxa filosa]|eukprot:ETO31025.1 hypothetical protein RFI_06098 [Reticulomyxa filosa]